MRLSILVVLLAASLAWASAAPGRQFCTTRPCAPVPAPMVAGHLATVTSDQLVIPPALITLRDCVGLPHWAVLIATGLLSARVPGSRYCTTWWCAPIPAPMVAGRLV